MSAGPGVATVEWMGTKEYNVMLHLHPRAHKDPAAVARTGQTARLVTSDFVFNEK